MDETTMEEMAKAYHEALKGKTFPKTRPFPDRSTTAKNEIDATCRGTDVSPIDAETVSDFIVKELAAVEFLLQCAVKSEKTDLLIYLRSLLYDVMRRYPVSKRTVPTERFLSPETAKQRLSEYAVDRLSKTDALPNDATLYAVNNRILALIPLI